MRAARVASIVLLGLGLAGYSAWLLEFFMQTGVSPTEQPVWDLFYAQPVFQVSTALGGLAFFLTGPTLMRLAPVHWTGRLTSVSVSAFGIVLMVYAGVPETVVTPHLLNAAFALGALSLVLWWPAGWRTWAVGGLAIVLVAWALMVVSMLAGHLEGVFTRVQLAVHAVELVIGGAYVVQTPVPVSGRKLSVADAMLRSNRHRK
ncbi:hypothetical protein ATK30_2424 [Amycolatopsis echigonensis]|uniref:DUF998 domain-containing protein n=1 Tax=Amycolatopsis echigonensis TaxID=2576905 RepID=A0A2N3WCP6_9PSEU|nr:hypothetical protein [Amycolatopsis niigatensis]PKV91640.1 hypothetical protein ATK30_2424 [Amycolatopsis niigatensis]